MNARLLGTVALAAFGLMAASVHADTLGEAASKALESNPTLMARREQVGVAKEGYAQARSALLPTVNAISNFSTNRPHPSSLGYPLNTSQTGLTLDQSVYAGGRNVAGMRAAKANINASREQLRDGEQGLFQDVVTTYLGVQLGERTVQIYGENVAALRRYVDQVVAQRGAGDVTQTDVAQAKTELAAAEIALAQVRGSLDANRADYISVVGAPPVNIVQPPALDALLPKTMAEAMDRSDTSNPLVRRAMEADAAATALVAQARGLRMPTVSLSASYTAGDDAYFDGSPKFLGDTKTTLVGLGVSVPLFAGGQINSRIREAIHNEAIARTDVENARREARRQVQSAWSRVEATRQQIRQGEEQVQVATQAVSGMNEEYRAGLRSTYEVLNAEQELRNAEIALATARHDGYVSNATVLGVLGDLSVEVLTAGAAPRP